MTHGAVDNFARHERGRSEMAIAPIVLLSSLEAVEDMVSLDHVPKKGRLHRINPWVEY
jgi:hypothetical protein